MLKSSVSTRFIRRSTTKKHNSIFHLFDDFSPNFLQFEEAFEIKAKKRTRQASIHIWHGITIKIASKSPGIPNPEHNAAMLKPRRYPLKPIKITLKGAVQTVSEQAKVTPRITVKESVLEKNAPNPLLTPVKERIYSPAG